MVAHLRRRLFPADSVYQCPQLRTHHHRRRRNNQPQQNTRQKQRSEHYQLPAQQFVLVRGESLHEPKDEVGDQDEDQRDDDYAREYAVRSRPGEQSLGDGGASVVARGLKGSIHLIARYFIKGK